MNNILQQQNHYVLAASTLRSAYSTFSAGKSLGKLGQNSTFIQGVHQTIHKML